MTEGHASRLGAHRELREVAASHEHNASPPDVIKDEKVCISPAKKRLTLRDVPHGQPLRACGKQRTSIHVLGPCLKICTVEP
ncbi:hypothetical protein MJO28_002763 [Puccinia striiformis f. sp. tritici]|uniref:Uncharacterized protein n=1 Tax=Puccinia striiformis f. sp. tritici TaxID=168172 RepID=A0ACC0ET10_9BASI|nr:hypothetical protein MJO28_002763 [Puccinia striiformis f. sp. tritici]